MVRWMPEPRLNPQIAATRNGTIRMTPAAGPMGTITRPMSADVGSQIDMTALMRYP
jgi:hypothetical protein